MLTSVGLWDFVRSPVVLFVLAATVTIAWPLAGRLPGPRVAAALFVVSVGVIVALTLTPSQNVTDVLPPVPHFLRRLDEPIALAREFFARPAGPEEKANVYLYVPVGAFGRFVLGRWTRAALFGFLLTASIETLQILIDGRAGSVTDIRNNTIGTLLGAFTVAAALWAVSKVRAKRPD